MKRTSTVFTALLGVESLILVMIFAPVVWADVPGLVSWWQGEGNANDSQDGHHGTLQNGVTFAPGVLGQAFSLDGVDDRIDVGGVGISTDTQPFSIAAWICPNAATAAGGTHFIVANGGGRQGPAGTQGKFTIQLYVGDEEGAGNISFEIGGQQAYGARIYTANVATADQWLFVVGTYDGSRTRAGMKVYVNGKELPISNGGSGFDATPIPFDDWHIGAEKGYLTDPAYFFGGLIDEVKIVNRALTSAEISAEFGGTSAGKCKPSPQPPSQSQPQPPQPQSQPPPQPNPQLKGDCDGDGKNTEVDALCALEMSTRVRPVNLIVDMDDSGDVTSRDAVVLLQRAIGK